MLPKREIYDIYPSVIKADVVCKMTIVATERAFMFFDGVEYSISIASVNTDDDYYKNSCKKTVKATAHDGIIKFEYTFKGEQEHLIILEKDGVELCRLHVYSLYDDLYDAYPLKGDFHVHSYRSDGTRDPAALAGFYREQGYDLFSLTDHNRFYPGGEIDEIYNGVNTGFIRVTGEEVHAPTNPIHIVRVGGRDSVCEQYFKYPEKYNCEIEEYEKKVPSDIPREYVSRYARAMWATDKIHESGGIAIFPHPYWRPRNQVFNVCDDFARILLKSGMFDAYELIGGMTQTDINRSVNLWAELKEEGVNIPVVGSSDVHVIENSVYFPFIFTILFAKDKSEKGILNAIKDGNCVAVEANGNDECSRQHRAYGKLRYVSYAQYLIEYFYPKYQRLCSAGGVFMRLYALNDTPRELVELCTNEAEKFKDRFFGKKPAHTPDSDMLEFEERWRDVQLNGPRNKGSNIYGSANRQI